MKVSFYTIGCRLNQAETAVLEQSFRNSGFAVVAFDERADVVVINTCTVTEKGDAETRKAVHRAVRVNPRAKVALIGCQAQTQKEELFSLPNVQWVVGTERKMELAQIIRGTTDSSPQLIAPVVRRVDFRLPAAAADVKRTRANLKIQDGCDFFCSFCEIPYARGRSRSRVFDDILHEARELAQVHREVVLTGVNIGTYEFEGKTLLDVVDAVSAVEGIERVRISSVEGLTLPIELFDRMVHGKLCRHLHISLQSAENNVLRAMNRRYTIEEFAALLDEAVRRVPGICLGTDVIVGFPGESDERFEEAFRRLEALPFAYMHVFSYSDRRHAAARRLSDKVSPEVIEGRSRRLRELSLQKRSRFLQQHRGSTLPVLFERQKNGWWSGVTDNYIRVQVQSFKDLYNSIFPVRLSETNGQTMIGTLYE